MSGSGFPGWFDPAQDAMLTPKALRGLVHPIRLRLLDLLQANGPATASGLGERVGQSSGVTSYHLRVLAEHGFIVEDEDRGNGRDRWWRAVHRTTSFTFRMPEDPDSEESLEEAERYVRLVAEDSYRRVLAFVSTLAGRREELAGMPWTISEMPLQLTLEQAADLRAAIHELALPYRRDPSGPPPPADTVRAHLDYQLTPEDS
jgi:DNA-binding transcriptional ArsR family regulator